MFKQIFTLSFLLMFSLSTFSQTADFNKIVPGEDSRPKTFEDYLVQLAWNNSPQSKILSNEQKISELEIDLTQREWMKNLQAQWNLNEISLSNILFDFEDPLFVALPIWNVTATVDLNTVFNRKKRIQIAEQKTEITKHSINLLKMEVRAIVLARYYAHTLSIDILKVRTEAEQDASENQTLLKELFLEDKAEFEELNRATLAYTNAKEARINAEMDIRLTRIALEEIIGIKYKDAERFGKAYKKE